MALKRKLELEAVDAPISVKQPRLIPFPNTEMDTDVVMSDGSISDLEPLYLPVHSRLPSNASCSSLSSASDSPQDSPIYPAFDLYPHDAYSYMDANFHVHSPSNVMQKSVGLLQPKNAALTHHGQNCSQIPKLRIACSPGLNGQRTMWAFCEQCGAIEMVDTD
ncbi:hypothetical protein SCP_0307830 [Sparassis crispa]|uniref:Uncharacterized protein n=1 Tax=Sparassis crispa TaxID=139825 RepID=A0A401GFW8_9APHY|nr:hypothetical protein SCP_0307830 [Sparassis crispa]GBE81059.1 hypothetical protein SCP_0307830 [Sparassis crispa]